MRPFSQRLSRVFWIFVVLTIVCRSEAQGSGAVCPAQEPEVRRRWASGPDIRTIEAILDTIWQNRKGYLADNTRLGLQASNLQVLYNAQGWTNNLLIWAAHRDDYRKLDELAGIYLIAYDYLEPTDVY